MKRYALISRRRTLHLLHLGLRNTALLMLPMWQKQRAILKWDDEHFIAKVSVAVSIQFPGCIIALGDGVKIVGPESVVEQMKKGIF